jgi:lipopolysaccharide export system protein LptA
MWIPLFGLLVAAALAAPSPAVAQDQCDPVDLPNVEEVYTRVGSVVYVQGPFLVRCTNGAELRANQGTVYEDRGEIFLSGNVSYRDPDRSMDAAQAVYTRPTRRLYATGDVVFTNRIEGTTIRGPAVEYFAEGPDRPEAQVIATGRPHLILQPKEGRGGDPLEIDADRLTIVGERDLTAIGSVVIRRPDLEATAGEARYNGDLESLELRQDAVMRGKENTLRGQFIRAQMENDELKEVHARDQAMLESEELTVTAADLQLFFRDGGIDRTVARIGEGEGAEQPVALSPTFRLVADSIDALAPGQQLERVTAIGRARGESVDTTQVGAPGLAAAGIAPAAPPPRPTAPPRPPADDDLDLDLDDDLDLDLDDDADPASGGIDRSPGPALSPAALISSDWITGDTVIAIFAARDTAGVEDPVGGAPASADANDGPPAENGRDSVALERIIARGAARSLYRVESNEDRANGSDARRGGINFVSASEITVVMRDGQMDSTVVSGDAVGMYLDPDPEAARGDSAAPPVGVPTDDDFDGSDPDDADL